MYLPNVALEGENLVELYGEVRAQLEEKDI